MTTTLDTLSIEAFTSAVFSGIAAFEEAGRILVRLIEQDADVITRIVELNPGFTLDMLETFERIGRGQLYYKLTINETPGVRALRRCPYSEQVKYFEEPLELLLMEGDTTDKILVSIHALTNEQARQAIGRGRIRTIPEQRAWLESERRLPPSPLVPSKPYAARRGKVVFYEPCVLTVSELAHLISEAS